MLKASFKKYSLHFNFPAGTSRGVLHQKDSWFIFLTVSDDKTGIGECGLLNGLSFDDKPGFEEKILEVCDEINTTQKYNLQKIVEFPAIRFGLEMAFWDLKSKKERILFPSSFVDGKNSIPINGLVWMGKFEFMQKQIREKIEKGFSCIKLKIGAIDFEQEINLLKTIREEFSEKDIEIRVDANGAFKPEEALEKLNLLSEFDLHSIEQPIKQGQRKVMAKLCQQTPLPIALDEELIGVFGLENKKRLLEETKPQYIILKPSLLGGFEASEEWIKLAEERRIGWWVTSALESNIGLSAIAQWTYTLNNKMPQGLGTGQLYTNNFASPLNMKNGKLNFDPKASWNTSNLFR